MRKCRIPLSRPFLICICGFLFGLFSLSFFDNMKLLLKINFDFECMNKHGRENVHQKISHNGDFSNSLLMVGVMTAAKYVDSRAYNVWKTWAVEIPGRIFFFVSEDTRSKYLDEMPIIHLKGVDDVYPPQKKSFAMMRWMYDNYLNDFQWFMRADDDLYVRNNKLEPFLRSLDPNKAYMIGQAGLGKGGEYGQLSLGEKDNYCMGGPGVILSREALRVVGPHLESCLFELMTSHEDVELGRCVRKHVGIACTWNYEMQTLFHNNQTGGWSEKASVSADFRKVITLHPIKNPHLMQKVHVHARTIRLQALRERRMMLRQELDTLRSPAKTPAIRLIRRILTKTSSARALRQWDYISMNKLLFCANQVNCPRHTIDASMRTAINQIIVKLFDQFNANARQRGRVLQFQNVQYGYVRVEPRHGVDYILDIVLWFKKFKPPHRATLSVRRHAYIQQKFGPIEALTDVEFRRQQMYSLRDASTLTGNGEPLAETIYLITALQGRADTFRRFVNNLRHILPADESDSVKMVVVLYKTDNELENQLILETVAELSAPDYLIAAAPPTLRLQIDVVEMNDHEFNRGQALNAGVARLSGETDPLLFFVDVDMVFNYETLQRIRLNTIAGFQVYFPIILSQYSPQFWFEEQKQQSHLELSDKFSFIQSSFSFSTKFNKVDSETIRSELPSAYRADRGYFRSFGYGIASIYRKDFFRVGAFNTSIQGWGLEDVDFFERCVRTRPLRVLRAPDPSLVHIFHPIQCNAGELPTAQYRMCVGTKAASMASRDFFVRNVFGGEAAVNK